MPVKSVFGEIRALNVVEIEISSPYFDTYKKFKIEVAVTHDLTPPLVLSNGTFSKHPDIFSRRTSDDLNNKSVNYNKMNHISRASTPASKAEVEPTKRESSEIETRAVASSSAAAAGTATVSKEMIYNADIATRARDYDSASLDPGENSSDSSVRRSVSAGEALKGNKLFHRDPIVNDERSSTEQITDARSRQLKSNSAISTKGTDSRANDKNHRPKNLGSEASVRRDHETTSDTHKPKTNQKRKSDMNTAHECKDAGARLKESDERGKACKNEAKNK